MKQKKNVIKSLIIKTNKKCTTKSVKAVKLKLKSSPELESSKKKIRLCSHCAKVGHDRRNCSQRK